MSNCGCGPTGPNFCAPPTDVTTIVAGPIGATGPSGPTGPAGFGVSGPTGPTGPQGVPGPIGQGGVTGPSGVNGTNGPPIAFFTGVVPGATGATGAISEASVIALQPALTIDMGQNPLATGTYLCCLTVQHGWPPLGGSGTNTYAAEVDLMGGVAVIQALTWAVITPFNMGSSQTMAVWFRCTLTLNDELYVKAVGNFFLQGAQLAVFQDATNVITSPGFI